MKRRESRKHRASSRGGYSSGRGSYFLRGVKQKDVIIGATGLYEIDWLVDDYELGDEPQEQAEVERLLDELLPSHFSPIAMCSRR